MKRILVLSMLVAGGAWLAGCTGGSDEPAAPETNKAGSNPLTAPTDYLGALGKAKTGASVKTGLLSLERAVAMFHTQEGRYPKDLTELVGNDYLSRLPDLPANMKYDYNPENGKVTVVAK